MFVKENQLVVSIFIKFHTSICTKPDIVTLRQNSINMIIRKTIARMVMVPFIILLFFFFARAAF